MTWLALRLQTINNFKVRPGDTGRGLQCAAPAFAKLDPFFYPIDITGSHSILELSNLIVEELFHRFIHRQLLLFCQCLHTKKPELNTTPARVCEDNRQ